MPHKLRPSAHREVGWCAGRRGGERDDGLASGAASGAAGRGSDRGGVLAKWREGAARRDGGNPVSLLEMAGNF
jgi:hypothetical protein